MNITAKEARIVAARLLEWPKGNGDVITRTRKGEAIFNYEDVTTGNAKYGCPGVQLGRLRKQVKHDGGFSAESDLIIAYYEETGRDYLEDVNTRPRTVSKVFERIAKRLEKGK